MYSNDFAKQINYTVYLDKETLTPLHPYIFHDMETDGSTANLEYDCAVLQMQSQDFPLGGKIIDTLIGELMLRHLFTNWYQE